MTSPALLEKVKSLRSSLDVDGVCVLDYDNKQLPITGAQGWGMGDIA